MIKLTTSFPVYIVNDIMAAREYYCDTFDFTPVYEADWYIHLASSNGVQLGFLAPDHPTQPKCLRACHSGEGSIFSLEVDDVDAAYQEAKAKQLKLLQDIKTEEWGQRHFIFEDPNKLMIDIIQNTEPSEEHKTNYK